VSDVVNEPFKLDKRIKYARQQPSRFEASCLALVNGAMYRDFTLEEGYIVGPQPWLRVLVPMDEGRVLRNTAPQPGDVSISSIGDTVTHSIEDILIPDFTIVRASNRPKDPGHRPDQVVMVVEVKKAKVPKNAGNQQLGDYMQAALGNSLLINQTLLYGLLAHNTTVQIFVGIRKADNTVIVHPLDWAKVRCAWVKSNVDQKYRLRSDYDHLEGPVVKYIIDKAKHIPPRGYNPI
jgi:hypothetical protein